MNLKYSDIQQYVYKGVTHATIALRFGCTVDDVVNCIDQHSNYFVPHQVAPYRCSGCGLRMQLKPCVECKMQAKRDKTLCEMRGGA